jgi:hypothetical protein
MATTNSRVQLIDLRLQSLGAEIEGVEEIALEWDSLEDGVRVSLSLDWDQDMAIVRGILEPAYRSQEMTSDQRRRYERLRQELRRLGPTLDRLGLQAVPAPPAQ